MTVLERIKRVYDHYINKGKIWDWVANDVFDLTTYDGELDKCFSKKILEVCKVILNGKNFEYIRNNDNYVNYILVCQTLVRHNWIDWGTSIRGAWFDDDWGDEEDCKKPLCSFRCIYTNEEKEWVEEKDTIPFTKENLKELIKFIEAESGEGVEL